MNFSVFDPTRCMLGEGALWHPLRQQLFWVDILNRQVHSRAGDSTLTWTFDGYVGALFVVDADHLIVHEQGRLCLWNIADDRRETLCPVEPDCPQTRPNDGRADPFGGLWCSTMGLRAEAGYGTIYRWYQGRLTPLFKGITIPNAICFAPDGRHAYFADTAQGAIQRVALDQQGWPAAPPETWLDLTGTGHAPDGAVTDAAGNLWSAQWGSFRVACYRPDGTFSHAVAFGAEQTSCPAFGGAGFTTLYCTSAAVDLPPETQASAPATGQVMCFEGAGQGRPEYCVTL